MDPQQLRQRPGIRVRLPGRTTAREYDTTVPGSEFTDRFRATLELYEVGENMLRQRLRRERPAASAQDIDDEIAAWLRRRPGAEHGDHPGPPSSRRL